MSTIVEQIGSYAEQLSIKDIESNTVDFVKRLLLDGIACAFGGLEGGPVRMVRETVMEMGGAPQATLFGRGTKTTCMLAALANGVSLRYLDYNDVYSGPSWHAHPSDMIASLLAVAEWHERSGAEYLVAMLIAYEFQIRFCELPATRNIWYEGWDHAGSTAFASAAGIGRLLGLSASQIAQAVALAGARGNTLSQIRVGNIPMDKSLSSPVAAANSVLYSLLAKRGFTGCMTLVEGKYGFQHAVAKGTDMKPLVPAKGQYLINKICTKPYVVDAYSIAVVQAALELRAEHKIGSDEIQSVTIFVPDEVLTKPSWTIEKLKPRTKEDADHSPPYSASVAFIAGEVTPKQFTDEWLFKEDVAKLMAITKMESSPDFTELYKEGHRGAAVEVKTARGTFSRSIRHAKGDYSNPMSWDDVANKFLAEAEPLLGKQVAQRVVEQAHGLERISNMRLFVENLAGPKG